jgi:hypothetical protein
MYICYRCFEYTYMSSALINIHLQVAISLVLFYRQVKNEKA